MLQKFAKNWKLPYGSTTVPNIGMYEVEDLVADFMAASSPLEAGVGYDLCLF